MKGVLPFTIGLAVGVLATIFVYDSLFTTEVQPSYDNQPSYDGLIGLRIFSEKGECVPTEGRIEVFQVLKPNMALARTGEYLNGAVILLIDYDGNSYYDDQKIKIPAGKCARQIGTYQYTTTNDFDKTVPAVVIE